MRCVLVRVGAVLAWLGGAASSMAQQADAAALPTAPIDAAVLDSHWLRRPLAELAGSRATVLFFATIDCPLVQRYLPRVQQLALDYTAQGVRVLVVNVGADDRLVDAAGQQVESAPATLFAKDDALQLATAVGVDRTAVAVVLDAARKVVYRGRIDSQYHYTGAAPAAGRADLRSALDELLAGQPVSVPTTASEGCKLSPPIAVAAAAGAAAPTFARDVAPLLQQHCEECHRPGGAAPFALQTFAQARSHLAMLGEVVEQQRMPPWYGSSKYGTFVNHRGLDATQRATIARWVAAGGPEGDAKDAPPPRVWPQVEWRIGEPDLVLKVPTPIRLPADGVIPYRYFVLPFRFEEETWVEAIEIKPEQTKSLHHCNLARVQWGEKFSQDGFVTGQVPGGDAMVLDPGTAVRIPKGSALVLQAHYVTTGEPVVDHLRIGLRFPRVPVDQEVRVSIVADGRFAIPPGALAHPVRAARTIGEDAIGIGMFVHMHLRGRDMTVTAQPKGGEPETLVLVPNYNFDWQQSYRWERGARRFAAGTRLQALAHFDNSASNPFNPDPQATVRFGQETVDEMMYAFVFYVHEHERLQLRVDPKTGHAVQ